MMHTSFSLLAIFVDPYLKKKDSNDVCTV